MTCQGAACQYSGGRLKICALLSAREKPFFFEKKKQKTFGL
jgi:hypothetical protein